jgi:sulfite reductase alpha subunit-like flavoprotein
MSASSRPLLLAAGLVTATAGILYYLARRRASENISSPGNNSDVQDVQDVQDHILPSPSTINTTSSSAINSSSPTVVNGVEEKNALTLRIAYGSQTGTSKKLAELLGQSSSGSNFEKTVVNMSQYDVDNLEREIIIVFVMCTWEGGVPPESAVNFCDFVEDLATDFRVSKQYLRNVSYAVFGLGSSEYEPIGRFCKASLRLDENMESELFDERS